MATKRRTAQHTATKHKAVGPSLSKVIGRTPIRSAAKAIGSIFSGLGGGKKTAKRRRK